MDKPSRVFAMFPPPPGEMKERPEPGWRAVRLPLGPTDRELRVAGTAELRVPADLASLRVCVSSSKESVNEASNSVSRRLDYILQTVRQHGVKDEDTLIRQLLHREGNQFLMNAEVTVTFSDFTKMEQVCKVLLEKMDKNVTIGSPHYHHSPECLSHLRRHVCASAVQNAKQKASDISQLLGQTLGSPQLIVEEEIREVQNNESEQGTVTNLPHVPSVTAFSRVAVTFSLKDGVRNKV